MSFIRESQIKAFANIQIQQPIDIESIFLIIFATRRLQFYRLKLYLIFGLHMDDCMRSSNGQRRFSDVLTISALAIVMSPNDIESVH